MLINGKEIKPKPIKDPKARALAKELKAAHKAHKALRDTSLPGRESPTSPGLPVARLWHPGTPNQNPAYDSGPEKDRYEAALKAHTDYHAHRLVPHD